MQYGKQMESQGNCSETHSETTAVDKMTILDHQGHFEEVGKEMVVRTIYAVKSWSMRLRGRCQV